jgi:hypothetical protein
MPARRQARPQDWDAIRSLLLTPALPVDDPGPDTAFLMRKSPA